MFSEGVKHKSEIFFIYIHSDVCGMAKADEQRKSVIGQKTRVYRADE
jgi:hypothetical protein